ncbi:MAG: CHC2 zinc finger domain-containing protein [Sedimenticola sp.]
MARIPEDEINRLKEKISLVRLAESQGHKLKKQGKDFLLSCPFHEEDTPSLVITPSKNLFRCFGCDAGGSVIDWMMKTQNVSFRHAVELLQKEVGLSCGHSTPTSPPKSLPPLAANPNNQATLKRVIDYYHECLKSSPEALEYLESRGLKDTELIERFKLGYANRSLAYRLPEKNRKAGAEVRGQLQAIGILRKSGHEHFNGSLVVPVADEHGVISEVYGRKIRKDLRKGTALHLYLPGPHQGVWNTEALKAYKEIILCEALIDAMTFWVHGFRNVTTSYGTGGFTDDHLAAFKSHGIERVLIAYDRDEAGNRAAEELTKKLMVSGIDCFRVLVPKGMDVNEYALQVKPAKKSLGLVIRKAEWLGNGQKPEITTASETLAEVIETPPATPLPEAPKPIDAEITEREVLISLGGDPRHPASGSHKAIPGQNRRYRIRGLSKNMSYEQLKINLLVNVGEHIHVDQLDLYNAKARQSFIKQAATELGLEEGTLKSDLGKVLLKLETLQDQQISQTLKPEEKAHALSDEEQQQALALLRDKELLNRILTDFETCGVVGEETNKLMGYLACVSRKLDKPLAVIIQSTSAAGKSALMDAILNLMPEEERVQYSAMTGQSLFYMGETNLKNKILAIAEEEGAENAAYALKLLQSEGELTIASTGKDESSGSMVTKEYRVEGPVMLFLTTTAIDIDEELMNRCVVLSVNESREQTQAIHAMQRKRQTLEGLLQSEDRKQLIELHRNSQRLLRPLLVANPFAEQLTFIDDKTRTRRDHMKYLSLIKAIALLHQYQREVKSVDHGGKLLQFIEVTTGDIEIANKLAHEVLGRTLDELPPQTRKLLQHIHAMVKHSCKQSGVEPSDYRFSRKEVRTSIGWTDFQIKKHITRLQEMEYLLVHRGGRGQSFVYELLYQGEGEDGKTFLLGLTGMEKLHCDNKKKPLKRKKKPSSSPQVAAKAPPSSPLKNPANPTTTGLNGHEDNKQREKGLPLKKDLPSCHTPATAN